MRARAVVVPLAVAVSLGLAACGGDDDKKLSRSDLSKKVSAICEDSRADGKDIDQPADLTADPVASGAYFEKILPIAEKQAEKFEDLKPDDEVKADWDQLMARQKQEVGLIRTLRDKAKAKDQSGLQDLQKLERADAKFVTEAKAVGADGCVQD